MLGRDIVPDQIPVLGGLDDLVVVVLAVDLFIDGVPDELLAREARSSSASTGRHSTTTWPRIRRLTPGPVRKTIRRIPGLIAQAGEAIDNSGIGPRVRSWITKEESIA